MTELFLHQRKLNTVFDLLGDKENDLTYSVGWALAQSDAFCSRLMAAILPKQKLGEIAAIHLQEHGSDAGYTDIEIIAEQAHAIIEAKRGWNLPTASQLKKYAHRLKHQHNSAIVVMSECSPEYVRGKLPHRVTGVAIQYLSWKQVASLVEQSRASASFKEKRVLDELHEYLQGVMSMQNQETNLVYVLSLGSGTPNWSKLSWIEFVTKKCRYFHPFGGNGWPTEPPNYLAFRYKGKLQSIHHVESYEVTDDLSKQIPEINKKKLLARESGNFLVYKLGPAITPMHEVKTGNLYANGRYRVALDLLLTCKTISEARDRTKKRLQA